MSNSAGTLLDLRLIKSLTQHGLHTPAEYTPSRNSLNAVGGLRWDGGGLGRRNQGKGNIKIVSGGGAQPMWRSPSLPRVGDMAGARQHGGSQGRARMAASVPS